MATQNIPVSLSDGKTQYLFHLAPDELKWSFETEFTANKALLTPDPDVTWKSSNKTLSLPKVLFISPGMVKDMTGFLEPLRLWASQGTGLSLTFGKTVIPRCFLTRLEITEKQWRLGRCTQAEASLDFIIGREPVNRKGIVDPAKLPKLAQHERKSKALLVQKALNNPAMARQLNLPYGAYNVTLDESGNATVTKDKKTTVIPYNTLKTLGIL
jgi:hypothetical protein